MGDVNFKIILKYSNNTKEIRRFELPDNGGIHLGPFEQHIVTLCPNLLGKERRLYWIDSDGDEVEIRTDGELSTALRSMPDLKKIYVDSIESGQERKENKEIHHRITCDECGATVAGFRYKCLQCPDYDLCENCESKCLHSNHIMMRLPKELPRRRFHHCWSKIYDSVDYLAKSIVSSEHSEKDHSERGGSRKCGRHRSHCNWDEKDSDGGADGSKDKSEGWKYEKRNESRGVPIQLLFSPDGRTMMESCETIRRHFRDYEDPVLNTVKFFVDAVKDGFTPKTRSERGRNESGQQNASTETEESHEKMKDGEGDVSKAEDESKQKSSQQYVPGTTAEPFTLKFLSRTEDAGSDGRRRSVWEKTQQNTKKVKFPVPSAPKVETTERETETEKTGNLYPTVPLDPKIEEALNGMLAMGFSNEGGTLQKIVEEMDGDILKVLECIDSSLH